MCILKVDNIHKSFQENFFSSPFQVLKGVSFRLEEGSITGFLGANGAGKTTLIKIILQFISQNEGQVQWSPRFGDSHRMIMSHIGFFPERPYFHPHLTGREFLDYMGKLSGMRSMDIKVQVKSFSAMLNIAYALDRKILGYSKGMLQRLGFVSAIIHDPELLIFDEPLAGLDPIGRQEFKVVLKQLHNRGKTIFFSSHIVPDIEEACEDVLVLDSGTSFYHGSIDHLLKQNEKDGYHIRFRKKGNEREYIENIASAPLLSSFIQRQDVEIISVAKDRIHLEEVIYRSKIRK